MCTISMSGDHRDQKRDSDPLVLDILQMVVSNHVGAMTKPRSSARTIVL